MRQTRANVIPERLPMSGIGTARRMPRKGWRREEPGSDGGGSGGGSGGSGDDTGKTGGDDTGSGKDPKIDGDFDADRAKRTIASAREAEKKAIEKAKASDTRLKGVLAALGLGEDGKADPAQQAKELTERATKAEDRANGLAIKNAVRDGAEKHAGKASELLDSTSFLKKVAELGDPADPEFDGKVADLVKAAVKANPAKYGTSTGQGAGGRGADHSGGSNNSGRPKDLRDAYARKYS